MPDDPVKLIVLTAVVAIPAALALWGLLRLGRRADAVYHGRSMSTLHKRLWIGLMILGALIANCGAWLAGLGSPVGWHLLGLGAAWFLSGIWIPAYHDRELLNGVREAAQGTCAFGTLIMFTGIGLTLFGSPAPIIGTGSLGDVTTFVGLAVHIGSLWVIAPGPGGIAVG